MSREQMATFLNAIGGKATHWRFKDFLEYQAPRREGAFADVAPSEWKLMKPYDEKK